MFCVGSLFIFTRKVYLDLVNINTFIHTNCFSVLWAGVSVGRYDFFLAFGHKHVA